MAKKDLMYAVIERLRELGEGTLDAFFPETYSYAAVWRPLLGLERKRVDRHTISSALWRLQRQGLVERSGVRRQSLWRLTRKGRELGLERNKSLPREVLKPDGIVRLVIFDIPERERKKRDSIRAELMGYDFWQLQKSVWIGKCALPKSFTKLIDELDLVKNVHIFSCNKSPRCSHCTIHRVEWEHYDDS